MAKETFCIIGGVKYEMETEDRQLAMADWFFNYYAHEDSSTAAESVRHIVEWKGYHDVGPRTYVLSQ